MQMLSQNVKFAVGVTRSTSSTSTVYTSIFDTAGVDSIVARAVYVTAATGNKLKAQGADTNSTAAMEDLANTALGVGSSDEQQVLECYRPTKRYIRFAALRGTASLLDGIWVDSVYRVGPVTNITSGTIYTEAHASPTTGTA